MIEVLVLVFGTRWLADVARKRGLSAFLAGLLPVGWIAGEILGVVVGALLSDDLLLAIALGLAGAVSGGALAVATVHLLPANPALPAYPANVSAPGGPSAQEARDNVWAG